MHRLRKNCIPAVLFDFGLFRHTLSIFAEMGQIISRDRVKIGKEIRRTNGGFRIPTDDSISFFICRNVLARIALQTLWWKAVTLRSPNLSGSGIHYSAERKSSIIHYYVKETQLQWSSDFSDRERCPVLPHRKISSSWSKIFKSAIHFAQCTMG